MPTSSAPPPPKIPALYDFAEYRDSAGLASMDAATAYAQGASGKGVLVGIIDSGILAGSAEFSGRISSLSTDATGAGRGIADPAGHGTAVASIIGAARNGLGTMGVAYQANLMVLRAETGGSCTPLCSFQFSTIAHAIDLAVAAKVRVINLSMGGDATSPNVVAAVRNAAKAGVVVVIAAGNDNAPVPSVFAQVASDPAIAGLVLIAGSLDGDSLTMSSFSNRAGAWAEYYLSAPGRAVNVLGLDGRITQESGTSFSAPQVAGAVALLAQAFPNLTGKDIARILLSTAVDLGDKTVFGKGRLSLTNAMKPIGALSLAGSGAPVTGAAMAALSPPLGDLALAAGSLDGVVGLDSYRRAYRFNLDGRLRPSPLEAPLWPVLGYRHAVRAVALGGAEAQVFLTAPMQAAPADREGPAAAWQPGRGVLAGTTLQFHPRPALAVEVALGGAGTAGVLSALGRPGGPAPVVAPDPLGLFATGLRPGAALAAHLAARGLSFTVFAEQGHLATPQPGQPAPTYRAAGGAMARPLGQLVLGGAITVMAETGSVLGAQWAPAFGLGGARTLFVDGRAAWQLAPRWHLAGGLRGGWTRAEARGGLAAGATFRSAASLVELSGTSVLRAGDGLVLSWARPLRVSAARFTLDLPLSYSYATGQAGLVRRVVSAAPQGREQVFEGRYKAQFGPAEIGTSLAWRIEANNRAASADQMIATATARLRW